MRPKIKVLTLIRDKDRRLVLVPHPKFDAGRTAGDDSFADHLSDPRNSHIALCDGGIVCTPKNHSASRVFVNERVPRGERGRLHYGLDLAAKGCFFFVAQ